MRRFVPLALLASLLAAAGAQADPAAPGGGQGEVQITHPGAQPSARGAADLFTGSVRIDPLFPPHAPSRVSGGLVTFEPGARANWHTHPLGQTLIVTAGVGWVQQWAGHVQEMRPGDVVWIPPGVKHWHGAAAATGVTHIAIQESLDGRNVDWMEKVTDEQYRR
jgi:quercetin dioxygenase-like cupin family protein